MFPLGQPIGHRQPNPTHLRALETFVDAYLNATMVTWGARSAPHGTGGNTHHNNSYLLLYLLNGPGQRDNRYKDPAQPIAYSIPPRDLNTALISNDTVRQELATYVQTLVRVLTPRVQNQGLLSLRAGHIIVSLSCVLYLRIYVQTISFLFLWHVFLCL